MAQYTMTISPDGPDLGVKSDQTDKVACLQPGDELALKISGFPSGYDITWIKFYVSEDAEREKKHFATWQGVNDDKPVTINHTAAVGGTVTKLYSVVKKAGVVYLKNSAETTAEHHVWYAVYIWNGRDGAYLLDPEIINTGDRDNRAGFADADSDDGEQTLLSA
jgi:hypothetical protein